VDLGLQLLDLGVGLVVALVVARLAQLGSRLALGLALGLLGGGDLGLDVGDRTPDDGPGERRHRGVHDLRALLGDLRQQGRAPDSEGLRDLAEGRVGVLGVGEVEQRADRQPGGAAEQDPEGPAQDADQQPDQPAGGRIREAGVADLVLDLDVAVLVSDDDGGLVEPDLPLRRELVQRGHRLEGAIVVGESHDDHVLGA
jgi:hypothetical protein